VSPAFRDHIEAHDVPSHRITVLPNGVDVDWFAEPVRPAEVADLKKELHVEGRFIASYIGTVGMAHGVHVMLEAARACPDPDVIFLVVGLGAEWQALRGEAESLGLTNVRIIEKQPRERIRSYYAISDVSVVHLRDLPAFRKVIPSKMFESMAMRCPLILGVDGQAAEILEAAGAGLRIRQEDAGSLIEAVLRLKEDPILRERFASNGETFVRANFDRREIARRYWQLLQEVAANA
jgi:glycosyltransferase involved in cell wall biosynthesis